MAKDILKKTTKRSTQLLGLGITTSVGSLTLGQLGGSAAVQAQAGLGNVAAFQPTFGVLVGGRGAIGLTKELLSTKSKKRKKKGF